MDAKAAQTAVSQATAVLNDPETGLKAHIKKAKESLESCANSQNIETKRRPGGVVQKKGFANMAQICAC